MTQDPACRCINFLRAVWLSDLLAKRSKVKKRIPFFTHLVAL